MYEPESPKEALIREYSMLDMTNDPRATERQAEIRLEMQDLDQAQPFSIVPKPGMEEGFPLYHVLPEEQAAEQERLDKLRRWKSESQDDAMYRERGPVEVPRADPVRPPANSRTGEDPMVLFMEMVNTNMRPHREF